MRKALLDMHFDKDVVFADEGYVTRRWPMTASNTGPIELFGIPPTGRPVTMGGQEIFKVTDGKLAEAWHCEDIPTMLQQLRLGLPPTFVMKASARRSASQYRREQRHRD
ncbi:ester cyclase [Aldersonia sp. NBC_00410]|uniref:ester cyclase n=1 Tax=Aldersonia sp. NBC_00410 TaxID=2975954 RepID=UPI0022515E50|nr:ester cyclase [Aldersonia sp. NBC_00410]MCX5044709.1 ester cyclase [Aldersonia sp. NBC_00410]